MIVIDDIGVVQLQVKSYKYGGTDSSQGPFP